MKPKKQIDFLVEEFFNTGKLNLTKEEVGITFDQLVEEVKPHTRAIGDTKTGPLLIGEPPMLDFGDIGDYVETLQNALGVSPVNGYFGDPTKREVIKKRKEWQLPEGAYVDSEFWKKLFTVKNTDARYNIHHLTKDVEEKERVVERLSAVKLINMFTTEDEEELNDILKTIPTRTGIRTTDILEHHLKDISKAINKGDIQILQYIQDMFVSKVIGYNTFFNLFPNARLLKQNYDNFKKLTSVIEKSRAYHKQVPGIEILIDKISESIRIVNKISNEGIDQLTEEENNHIKEYRGMIGQISDEVIESIMNIMKKAYLENAEGWVYNDPTPQSPNININIVKWNENLPRIVTNLENGIIEKYKDIYPELDKKYEKTKKPKTFDDIPPSNFRVMLGDVLKNKLRRKHQGVTTPYIEKDIQSDLKFNILWDTYYRFIDALFNYVKRKGEKQAYRVQGDKPVNIFTELSTPLSYFITKQDTDTLITNLKTVSDYIRKGIYEYSNLEKFIPELLKNYANYDTFIDIFTNFQRKAWQGYEKQFYEDQDRENPVFTNKTDEKTKMDTGDFKKLLLEIDLAVKEIIKNDQGGPEEEFYIRMGDDVKALLITYKDDIENLITSISSKINREGNRTYAKGDVILNHPLSFNDEVVIPAGNVEIKKLPYKADSYLSEFFSYGKDKDHDFYAELIRDKAIINTIYNYIIQGIYKNMISLSPPPLLGRITGGEQKVNVIALEDRNITNADNINFYWSNKGRASCQQLRLSIRFQLKQGSKIYKLNKSFTQIVSEVTLETQATPNICNASNNPVVGMNNYNDLIAYLSNPHNVEQEVNENKDMVDNYISEALGF